MSQAAPKRTSALFGFSAGALKVLLVDDDPLFRSRMQRAATSRGWALTAHARLSDVDMGNARDFDVLVLNSYLDEVRHAGDANPGRVLGALPAVLVSNFKTPDDGSPWPATVRRFARKADGCDAILEAASTAASERGGGAGLLGRIKGVLKR